MWYRFSSEAQVIEKITNELIRNRIRKKFVQATNTFPSEYDIKIATKRVKHHIKMYYGSVNNMRKESFEKNISKLVDRVFNEMKW